MKKFKCPECNEFSTADKWNEATAFEYNNVITKIDGDEDPRHCDFVCPECSCESIYELIVEATYYVSIKNERYEELLDIEAKYIALNQ